MKLTEYMRGSSTGVKLIVLLVLILCGIFVIAIPMLFIRGEYAPLTGMYLQNIGMFILPAWFAAMLFWGNAGKGLHLNKAPRLIEILCIVVLYFVATPMFNRLVEWNESISLPAAFSSIEAWMRQQEEVAAAVTEQMLQIKSFPHFLAVILGIGVLTGMGEEMIFRGVLQQTVQGESRRAHFAVWSCAFLFSAIHLQFYGFFPRLLLGAFFGYLLVWSHNLWLPIFGHLFKYHLRRQAHGLAGDGTLPGRERTADLRIRHHILRSTVPGTHLSAHLSLIICCSDCDVRSWMYMPTIKYPQMLVDSGRRKSLHGTHD